MQERGRQVFLQWRFPRLAAIAAPMQRLTGKIEAELNPMSMPVHVHANVGVTFVHRWPSPERGAKRIDDRVLGTLRDEPRMGDRRIRQRGAHRQRRVDIELRAPVDLARARIKFVDVAGVEHGYASEHPTREARPQTDPVNRCKRRHRAATGTARPHISMKLTKLV